MSNLKRLSNQDRQININIYDEYYRLHMVDGWHGTDKMQNYKRMLHLIELTGIPLDGKSCLDVGCGSGDLSALLRKAGAAQYLGIDLYQPAIKYAQEKYPRESFILGDFLETQIDRKFDYSFCSGSLSVKLATDNYAFLEATVEKMWKSTKIGLVFNMLTDADKNPDKDLFFYNVDSVLQVCKSIAPKANLESKHHPTEAEIHVYMWR